MRNSMSGERTTRPFLISVSSSMPQTFSPIVRMAPEMAAPPPRPAQFCLATLVRAHAGDDEGHLELDVLVAADLGSRRRPFRRWPCRCRPERPRPLGRPHDAEVGQVDGIVLLAARGDDAEGLGIKDLVAAVGGFPDLAHPDAAVDAGHAHAAEGLTDPSVLFLVRVAALRLSLVRLGMMLPPRYP